MPLGGTFWQLSALLLIMAATVQANDPSDTSYYAGVVEFVPALFGTPRERLKSNKQRMIKLIESHETDGLDILVFPEHVLNNEGTKTYVPSVDERVTPCNAPDYDPFLSEFSCMARARRMYVVINVLEKATCHNGSAEIEGPCAADGLQTFNTNVVFDRSGRVVSRYRKTHLYGYEWYSTNVLRIPEVISFKTDFGVTFGHFICFDMLFYVPAMRLVHELNITDFIYPTYWFNELPFLTAIQLQEGWAFANDVSLLAAGGSVAAQQNSGTGIYAGRFGRLQAVIHERSQTTLLKARVPKHLKLMPKHLPPYVQPDVVPDAFPARYTNLSLLRDYNVDIFTTVALPLRFTSANQRVCHNSDFCCDFRLARAAHNDEESLMDDPLGENSTYMSYRYRLGAYSGHETTFQRVDRSDLKICAIFACTSAEIASCGHIFPGHVNVTYTHYFTNITVSGQFPKAPHRLIMPSTVDGLMLPFGVDMYDWQEASHTKSKDTNVSIKLLRPKTDLLTFGIWANYYTRAVTKHNLDFRSNDLLHVPKASPRQLVNINGGSARLCNMPQTWLISLGGVLLISHMLKPQV